MIDPQVIPLRSVTEPDTIRLISTAYIDEPALRPLADHDDDLDLLEQIESLTSARRGFAARIPGGVAPDELLTEAYGFGWTYINAAFCYTRPSGNRFNGPHRGAWYATYGKHAAAAAQAEVGWHLSRELDAVGVYENVTHYRELIAGFTTRLHDLSDFTGEPFLAADPDIAYPEGQTLARALLKNGGNGVLYPSARFTDGRCLAAFRPPLVQNVRQGNTWKFSWSGKRIPKVRRI